jgi:hypothetical protein
MSIEAMRWAWKQDCTSAAEKLVLMALADNADNEGYCWPGNANTGERCQISAGSVRRHLNNLDAAGLIVKVKRRRRKDGTLSVWIYQLQLERTTSDHSLPVVIDAQKNDHICTEKDAQMSAQEPSVEASVNPYSFLRIDEISDEVEVAEVVPEWEIQFDQFWAIYPRRKDKQKAKIRFKNLSKKDREAAMAAITLHVDYWDRQRTEQEFIPYAVRWLGNRRWEDEIRYEAPKGKNNPVLENLARRYQSEHRASDPDTRQTDRGDNRLGRSSLGNLSIEVHSTD